MVRVIIATVLLLVSPPVIDREPEPEPVFWEVWTSQEPWEWWRLAEDWDVEDAEQGEHEPVER